jgi:cyclophilin family peptidyl-prolyl cis-trans isomerase/HEAT repeat protein
MKRFTLLLLFVFSAGISAQVPMALKVEIAQAEDARRYDQVLEGLMKWPGAELRSRAALAAGRIGDDKAIPALVGLLEKDTSDEVRAMAAFAIGEIESIKGADAILGALRVARPVASVTVNVTRGTTGHDSPTEAYRRLYAAVKSKDTDAIKSSMTRNTIEFGAMAAARSKKPVEQVYENGFTATTFSDSLSTIRDDRVKDNMGAVEVWNSKESKWEDLPFILEDGVWKLAIGELFANTYKSPGRGRDSLEREAGTVARLVEAAGKIAAANATDPKSKDLGRAVLDILEAAPSNGSLEDPEFLLAALTAALRARPENADKAVSKFLSYPNARIRADAANTLSRLRAKNGNETLRKMVASDIDPIARANAARALGAAEDKDAFNVLLKAATGDADSRVRVSAIRAVGAIKDAKGVDRLIAHGRTLLAAHSKSKLRHPNEKSELLEIATTLGRLLPNTEDSRAVTFINEFRMADSFRSPESEIALARIAPKAYVAARTHVTLGYTDRRVASAYAQGMEVIAESKDEQLRLDAAKRLTAYIARMTTGVKPSYKSEILKAMPNFTSAIAAFRPDNIDETLRGQLKNEDVFVRAEAAGAVANRPSTKENVDALRDALAWALDHDKTENDAQLAIMDALAKLSGRNSISAISLASHAPDYLVRKRAAALLKQFPGWSDTGTDRSKDWLDSVSTVKKYDPKTGTKLGQVVNTKADYVRVLSRKNGTVKAVLTTEKGTFTIDFYPEEAPLTVDNFIKLARSGYFNGVEVHRVVPNFVMQDGDPRGDGNGGPGWSIRCEVNMLQYERGMVGMALSGKDTGGSQWFVTHSPQPHLDGGYTIFGRVNEKDMKVVDNIVRGDKILTVKIVGR